jgi:hypothetical protein
MIVVLTQRGVEAMLRLLRYHGFVVGATIAGGLWLGALGGLLFGSWGGHSKGPLGILLAISLISIAAGAGWDLLTRLPDLRSRRRG